MNNTENKIDRLKYLRSEVMIALFEIKLLTEKISEEDELIYAQTLADISNQIIKRAYRLNEAVGKILDKIVNIELK